MQTAVISKRADVAYVCCTLHRLAAAALRTGYWMLNHVNVSVNVDWAQKKIRSDLTHTYYVTDYDTNHFPV